MADEIAVAKAGTVAAVHLTVQLQHENSHSSHSQLCFPQFLGVFEGLRKIVGAKSEFSASVEHLSDCRSESAADLVTPISPVIRSTFKRKVDIDINSGFAIKKK